eukprot:TRINITY_DN85731_c0_g1_i1.p1 TRINITY_DN85731_c0_g1~~TRINITY_DN85731_c0_g1_i1.p1  ORF type:complete len:385 (-),score=73.77 TRINITY_DN85731_c0_g1_i1:231-1385(-)
MRRHSALLEMPPLEVTDTASKLLEKRREMYEIHEALQQQKDKFKEKQKDFADKEEQLKAKDDKLQAQLQKFHKFLQDNEAKRRRAETRAAEERAQIKLKNEELKTLQRQHDAASKTCQELEEEVRKHMGHEKFLDSVKLEDFHFTEFADLLARHGVLEKTNEDLLKEQADLLSQSEAVQIEFQNYRKEASHQILTYNNRVATLQRDVEHYEKFHAQLQQSAESETKEDSDLNLEISYVVAAIDNLYWRCVQRRPALQHHLTEYECAPNERVGGLWRTNAAQKKTGEKQLASSVSQATPMQTMRRATRQLLGLGEYIRDFRDIVQAFHAAGNKTQPNSQAVANDLPEAPLQPHIYFQPAKTVTTTTIYASVESRHHQAPTPAHPC